MQDKKRHIFMTGQMRVGKSTVIKKITRKLLYKNLNIDGYYTIAVRDEKQIVGYSICDFDGKQVDFAHIDLKSNLKFDKYYIDPSIFEDVAVAIMERSLKNADILVLDEIGVIEKNSMHFRSKLLECLDSSLKIIGVYQNRAKWFERVLDSRSDCKIIQVDRENRDQIHNEILKEMKIQ